MQSYFLKEEQKMSAKEVALQQGMSTNIFVLLYFLPDLMYKTIQVVSPHAGKVLYYKFSLSFK